MIGLTNVVEIVYPGWSNRKTQIKIMKAIFESTHPFIIFFVAVFSFAFDCRGQQVLSVREFGAIGDGLKDDAKAIQRTIDSCAAIGGGTVLLPAPFTYMAGPIELRSNVELHVQTGAVLLANPNEDVYTRSAFRKNLGEGMLWISGENLDNIAISGHGKIDGNGIVFMGKELEDSYTLKPFDIIDRRPHVLTLIGCTRVSIRDVQIGNSAYWTIHLVGCRDAVISGITLRNSLKVRNGDGIDLDHSKNVRISDSHIESGDDCICFKNRREYQEFGACENITVTNCTMTSRSCSIKIGSENMDTIRRVVVSNCIITDSNRGIGIQNRDEGVVSDILFTNIIIESRLFSDVWWGKAEPIYVTAYRRASIDHKDANWRFPEGATEGTVGVVRNIHFSNIICRSENGIYVSAETPDKISGVSFDRVQVHVAKSTSIIGGKYDRRPSAVEGFVNGTTSAFYIDGASNVSIKNCTIGWGPVIPAYYAFGVEYSRSPGIEISGIKGTSAFPKKLRTIKMRN
jgi:polygalacturonase